jgi:hypothetical protein
VVDGLGERMDEMEEGTRDFDGVEAKWCDLCGNHSICNDNVSWVGSWLYYLDLQAYEIITRVS